MASNAARRWSEAAAGEHDRFAGGHGAAAMNDAHVADVELLGAGDGDVLERLAGQRRMVLEHQGIDRVPLLELGPRKADEGHDGAVAPRLLG